MDIIILIGIIVGVLSVIMLSLTVINILQAGSKKSDGRSMEEIIGVDPVKATFEDVEKLSRKDKMQLFYAAETPDFSELDGEYRAGLLSGGVLGKSSAMFTHHVFPTGMITLGTKWVGKAFTQETELTGRGYNIFTKKDKNGSAVTLRIREMKTGIGPTKLGKDGKYSFKIDYRMFNSGSVKSMRDELRRINENLYIGAGYMGLGGGSINPAPFVLIGPPTPFKGADR
ncbi:MAG: hypothetical protein JRI91_02390 [Deltaproteobacteria bacterium]|nr:hypothetical protein [Deltaproteobacteria bacterium]